MDLRLMLKENMVVEFDYCDEIRYGVVKCDLSVIETSYGEHTIGVMNESLVNPNGVKIVRLYKQGENGLELAWDRERDYVELVDWSKIEVDTKIWVRDSEEDEWLPRHFAEYENDKIYAFYDGCSSWSAEESDVVSWNYAKLAK